MIEGRISTASGRLVRLGFQDPDRAADALQRLGDAGRGLLHLVATTADPDLALQALADLAERVEEPDRMLDRLADDEGTAMRLLSVLGASAALGDHLRRHPEHWRDLTDPMLGTTRPPAFAVRADLLRAVGAEPADASPVATLPDEEAVDALRVTYRRLLVRLASRDLSHGVGVEDVAAQLADLATAALRAALAVALAGVRRMPGGRLAVIAMGKTGGAELNYVSDVDVVFVAEPADATTTRAGRTSSPRPDAHRAGEACFPVDANLRPEGRQGALVRTLAGHVAYYQRWAKTWEFQALLKARPVAGDPELGKAYVEAIAPMVWSAAERADFVADVQAMRRRVERAHPRRRGRPGDQARPRRPARRGVRRPAAPARARPRRRDDPLPGARSAPSRT